MKANGEGSRTEVSEAEDTGETADREETGREDTGRAAPDEPGPFDPENTEGEARRQPVGGFGEMLNERLSEEQKKSIVNDLQEFVSGTNRQQEEKLKASADDARTIKFAGYGIGGLCILVSLYVIYVALSGGIAGLQALNTALLGSVIFLVGSFLIWFSAVLIPQIREQFQSMRAFRAEVRGSIERAVGIENSND